MIDHQVPDYVLVTGNFNNALLALEMRRVLYPITLPYCYPLVGEQVSK